MIVVTGMEGSGTSKACSGFAALGFAVYGDPFPAWVTPANRAKEPAGRYECVETSAGLRRDLGARVVVKIMLPALLDLSDIPQGTRIVICDRDFTAMSQDQKDYDGDRLDENPLPGYNWTLADRAALNQRLYARFDAWVAHRPVTRVPFDAWDKDPASNRRLLQGAGQ